VEFENFPVLRWVCLLHERDGYVSIDCGNEVIRFGLSGAHMIQRIIDVVREIVGGVDTPSIDPYVWLRYVFDTVGGKRGGVAANYCDEIHPDKHTH